MLAKVMYTVAVTFEGEKIAESCICTRTHIMCRGTSVIDEAGTLQDTLHLSDCDVKQSITWCPH